ncbi:hypothetical protein GGQ87_001700 [Brevundimonas alba]|uniref:TonB-dependent receptor plug domain-containing protein n=1 Tax=Brevundimonas alba TaxID=74314 RepID=A0A7X5YK66_9CAUL|nr:TonB-dependent receptor plug domain-containing protein [Brevundimonas alba]NJC41442.1 hypothetical protein [Brevundimonas alba]
MSSGLALLAALGLATVVHAQTPAPAEVAPAAAETQIRTYTPADFARFAPSNALDMLNQVPGFSIRTDVVERGLGEATGNVLVNGQRASNKSDDVLAQLRRIPAANVERIEIRDAAGLRIPGLSGQVANIIVKAGGLTGQYAYTPEYRARFTEPVWTRFNVSVSGERGPVQYTFGLENQVNHSGAGGDTFIYNPDGSIREERYDVWTADSNQPRATARFRVDGPGDAAGNLSLAYRDIRSDYLEESRRTPATGVARTVDFDNLTEGFDYEIGGDYEFAVGAGRLKLIGLDRLRDVEFENNVVSTWDDGRANTGDRLTGRSEESERIGRGEYRWKQGKADWQISVEAAFNALDSESRLFLLQPAGNYTEIPFPGATARVEEMRYEAIASYGRPLSPTFSFQIAAGAEYSELSQIGGNGLTRTFQRPKGQLTAVWQASPETRYNIRLQRRVGQLNFGDFLASIDLSNNTSEEENPNLVPPQSWEAEVEANHSRGAWGSSTLRVYAHLIDDIVDIIPVGATGQSVGNLDSATRYGVEWRNTVNLDPMGWRGVKIDTRLWFQETSLEDPVTGEDRPITGNLRRFVSLSFRHDVPETPWAYGFGVSHQRYAPTFRPSEVAHGFEFPVSGNVFVEHKDVYGLTVRASVGNVFSGESYLRRTSFAGRRTDPVSFYERRDRTVGPIYALEIRGKF